MSPGLKRARQPFFLRNAITGVVLFGFAAGVWAYSIGAVKQEDFSDVDEEARSLGRSTVQAAEDEARVAKVKAVESAATAGDTSITPLPTAPPTPAVSPIIEADSFKTRRPAQPPRGVVASLLWERYPRLFDPTTKTLIWGAPSVDRIGRMGDRVEVGSRKDI